MSQRGVKLTVATLVTPLSSSYLRVRLSDSLLAATAKGRRRCHRLRDDDSVLVRYRLLSWERSFTDHGPRQLQKGAITKTTAFLIATGTVLTQQSFATPSKGVQPSAPTLPDRGPRKEGPPEKPQQVDGAPKVNKEPLPNPIVGFPIPGQAIPPFPGELPPGAQIPPVLQKQMDQINKQVTAVNQAQKDYVNAIQQLIQKAKGAKSPKDLKMVQQLAGSAEKAQARLTKVTKQFEEALKKMGPVPGFRGIPTSLPRLIPDDPFPSIPPKTSQRTKAE